MMKRLPNNCNADVESGLLKIDDDNDGVPDNDASPLDASDSVDTDGDRYL